MRVRAIKKDDGFFIPMREEFKGIQKESVLMDIQLVEAKEKLMKSEKGWPEGFFENVVGGWSGDLERPPQGEFEEREKL